MAVQTNLIQIQSDLQNPSVRDEDLIKYANGSSASVPSFLALMEMSRRKQLEEGSKSFNTSNQQSIKDQLTNALTAPTQFRGAPTGAPPGQVNPTAAPTGISMGAAPTGIAMGAAPANQVDPTQAPPMPAGAMTAAAGGLMSLPIDHFKTSSYAGGGIVAFGDPRLNPDEEQLVSFPQERRPSPQALSDASIMEALRSSSSSEEAPVAPRGRGPAGFQSILDSLPKVQGNTMPAPQELTREQVYENIKENRRLAGVSEDPYAEVNKRQAAIEERQKAGYEQQGLDRLLTQLTAFSKADPSKGIGYAGAVSADASMALQQQQNALRDKQEQVQLDYAKNMAKEEDARRRNDATGIQAAIEAQKKDQAEYAKLLQKDQELQTQQVNAAAQIYSTQEQSKNQRASNANAAAYQQGMLGYYNRMADISEATKPTAADKAVIKAEAATNGDAQYKREAERIGPNGGLEPGSPEFNAALQRMYQIREFHFKAAGAELPPIPPLPTVIELAKKPGWWERNKPEFLGGAPASAVKAVPFDQLPK